MAKYMLILGRGENRGKQINSLTQEQIMGKYGEWTEKLIAQKRMLESHKLFDGKGKKLVWKNGDITDGPFSETKETIGGYYVIEAKDEAEATKIAKECPTLIYQGGFVEIREVEI